MIRIGICDDNVNMLENLKNITSNAFSSYNVDFDIYTYTNGQALLNEHSVEKFDILFLDIDMPGVNGFEISKKLRDDHVNCFIIFVTTHAELVYDSLNFQPFNFIRKNCAIPIEDSINQVTEKLVKHMKQNEKLLLRFDNGENIDIYVKDIVFIENDKHYLKYYTIKSETPFRVRGLISDLESKLVDCDFVRIHRSYIVNLRYVSKIDRTAFEIYLRDNPRRLQLSKNLKKDVFDQYLQYMRNR